MTKFVMIAASLSLLGAVAAEAAGVAKFPMAADGTTNIADCAKADVSVRNECISRSRPVSGKQLYAQAVAEKAVMAKKEAAAAAKVKADKMVAEKAAKVKTPVPEKVVGAPKGFKINKDGTTNIADCAKVAPSVRNECISRSRPLTGKELAKFEKSRAASLPKAPAKPAVDKKVLDKKATEKAPVVAAVKGKGFAIAKDGTTNIADCAKANPNFRNECISRSRPVSGKAIYASYKPKS
jgi:hypothetical protein